MGILDLVTILAMWFSFIEWQVRESNEVTWRQRTELSGYVLDARWRARVAADA
jgi:hypothetical protein